MSSPIKIQKQVHTSTILLCSNDKEHPFQSITWTRRQNNYSKQIKKQLFEHRTESVYQCSIFDLGYFIHLSLQNSTGGVKQYQYGPVTLENKLSLLLENQFSNFEQFPVGIILNKGQQYKAHVTLKKYQPQLVILIKIENILLQLKHKKMDNWSSYAQFLCLNQLRSSQLDIQIGQNKMEFLKNLRKIKIYCHYGSHLIINFQSQKHKDIFLVKIYRFLHHQNLTLNYYNLSKQRNKVSGSEIFAHTDSTDNLLIQKSLCAANLNQSADLKRDHISKKQLSQNKLTNVQKNFEQLLKNEQKNKHKSKRHQHPNQQTNQSHHIPKFLSFNRSHTCQKQEATRSKTKKFVNKIENAPKIYHNIKKPSKYYLNNKSNINQVQCQIPKIIQKPHLHSYQYLLQRNKFLQDQAKNLIQQNLELKHKIQNLTNSFTHLTTNVINQEHSIPTFLKSKQSQKEQMKSAKTFRLTEVHQIHPEEEKNKRLLQGVQSKFKRTSQACFIRQSIQNSNQKKFF